MGLKSKTRAFHEPTRTLTTDEQYDGIPLKFTLQDQSAEKGPDVEAEAKRMQALSHMLRSRFISILQAHNKKQMADVDSLKNTLATTIMDCVTDKGEITALDISFIIGFMNNQRELEFLSYASPDFSIYDRGHAVDAQDHDMNTITPMLQEKALVEKISTFKADAGTQLCISNVSLDEEALLSQSATQDAIRIRCTVPTPEQLAKAKPRPLSEKAAIASCVIGGVATAGAATFPIWGAISASGLAATASAVGFVGFMVAAWPVILAVGAALLVGGGVYLAAKKGLFGSCFPGTPGVAQSKYVRMPEAASSPDDFLTGQGSGNPDGAATTPPRRHSGSFSGSDDGAADITTVGVEPAHRVSGDSDEEQIDSKQMEAAFTEASGGLGLGAGM